MPPASQTALLNVAFAGEYLRIPDLKAFADRIKQYFQLSATFMRMSNNWEGLDDELKKHCHILKMQRVSPYELSHYYVEYMKRHALEADPRVLNKIKAQEYSKDLSAGYGGIKAADMWMSPAQIEQKQMAELQQKLNMGQGGHNGGNPYNQPGGFGGQPGGFGGQPNNLNNGGFNQQFGQQQGFNNNNFNQPPRAPPGSYNTANPTANQFQQQQYQQWKATNPGGPGGAQNHNQFAQQQGFGNFQAPNPQQQQQPNANNFFNAQAQPPANNAYNHQNVN